jgi:menaquinone-dependent protoporphyrinogen oxidase
MKTLVAVASKHGSTFEIAEAIGRALAAEGVANEVRPVDEVTKLDGYDAVVLGSAVYMGSWMDPALVFAANHTARLTGMPVWLFSSGPIGSPPHPTEEHAVTVADVIAMTGARGHQLFSGRLDRHSLGFGERALAIGVRAPEGDFRDWDAIAEWGHSLGKELLALVPAG